MSHRVADITTSNSKELPFINMHTKFKWFKNQLCPFPFHPRTLFSKVCWFDCWEFSSNSRILHLFGDVIIVSERLQILHTIPHAIYSNGDLGIKAITEFQKFCDYFNVIMISHYRKVPRIDETPVWNSYSPEHKMCFCSYKKSGLSERYFFLSNKIFFVWTNCSCRTVALRKNFCWQTGELQCHP